MKTLVLVANLVVTLFVANAAFAAAGSLAKGS
jgi:hypothetical protein